MKLNFIYSFVYFEILNKSNDVSHSWEDVKKMGKSFERKYSEELRQITALIPKVVNKSWTKNEINVFIVDWPGPSFSSPLTLKVRVDKLLMLVILAHELLHTFYGDIKITEKMELEINNNVKKVFTKLGLDIAGQMEKLERIHKDRFRSK